MKNKIKTNLFEHLREMFFNPNPCVQVQDIQRIASIKQVTPLQFVLIVRPEKWDEEKETQDFREITVMRSEMHYVSIRVKQGDFADSTCATTLEQALDAIYRYLATRDQTPSAIFAAASAFALMQDDPDKFRVVNCVDRIIIRVLQNKERTELHFLKKESSLVTIILYIDGELIFSQATNDPKELADKANFILSGDGPIADRLPKLLKHEDKLVQELLKKHEAMISNKIIAFDKESFYSFVSDLLNPR